MRRIWLLILTSLVVLGCTEAEPVVLIDGWWNADFAKSRCLSARAWMKENAPLIQKFGCKAVTSCPEMTPIFDACVLDTSGGIEAFHEELKTAFASNPGCRNIKLVYFSEPSKADEIARKAIKEPHWALTIDFEPGAQVQSWTVVSPMSEVLRGNGSELQISGQVCAIASRGGASIRN